jgi:hypothetical protein
MKIWYKIAIGAAIAVALLAFHRHEFSEDRLKSALPSQASAAETPAKTLSWVGRGESFGWDGKAWQRSPAQDYEFSVVQRRFADRWESVKSMHRRHPDYDGVAGNRDQVHYFRVDVAKSENGKVPLKFATSMGNGTGTADSEFRNFAFALDMDIPAVASWFVPFNRMKFTQTYGYEKGQLDEEITLVKASSSGEVPAFRIVERARLLAETALAGAPAKSN